jgi:signal transduction histidine kinase
MTSIRARLMMTLLMGLMAALMTGGTAVFWIARANLVRQFDDGLAAQAHALATLVKFEPEGLAFETGDIPAAMMAQSSFELRTESGRLIHRSENVGESLSIARPPEINDIVIENRALPEGQQARAAWLTIRPRLDPDDWQGFDKGRVEPELVVVAVAMNRDSINGALKALLAALVTAGTLLIVTATALVIVGVRWGLRPLERLRAQLDAVGAHTWSQRLGDAAAPRELTPVYRELNRMLDRVEHTLARERSFIDAAAHELRTPLAELRAGAEVALRWTDPDRAAAALGEALDIGHEMERLVESLLLISRGHALACDGETQSTPVAQIIADSIERERPGISSKALKVSVELDEGEQLAASREALEIIVRNLISNAVHYTPPGGHMSIRDGRGRDGAASVTIENGPIDLTESDLPRLFEPFWRMDSAHSDRRHCGLGLTVVQRLALATGLRVEASLDGNRLRMCVWRPIAGGH